MREAVVVPTVRAPITKAHRGAFKLTSGASRASFAVKAAVQRAGIRPTQSEDAILVCGYPQGSTWSHIARQAVNRGEITQRVVGGISAAGLFEIYQGNVWI